MDTGEVAVGMRARYTRTGTTGTVTALQAIGGETYAVLDSTGLLYRLDQLRADRRRARAAGADRRGDGRRLERERQGSPGRTGRSSTRQQLRGAGAEGPYSSSAMTCGRLTDSTPFCDISFSARALELGAVAVGGARPRGSGYRSRASGAWPGRSRGTRAEYRSAPAGARAGRGRRSW